MGFLNRVGISRYSIKNWRIVSWRSSRKLWARVRSGNPSNIVALKGTAVSIDPTASIHMGTGKVVLNASWCDENPFNTLFSMRERSSLIVHGSLSIYSNADISVNENATLEIGCGFINHGARIHCFNRITIGNGVYVGDDVAIRDSDGHEIVGAVKPMTLPIVIEDHVWIGARVLITKGVTIGEGAVVAAGSIVVNAVPPHSLVAGVPARVVRENVTWK